MHLNKFICRFFSLSRLLNFKLISYFVKQKVDVIFYSDSIIDEIYIRSTAIKCKKEGLNCVLLINEKIKNNLSNYGYIPTFSIHSRVLKYLKCKVFVTATSGVSKNVVYKNCVKVHMPHSLVSLHMAYPENAFDAYDFIFACTPNQMEEAKRNAKIRNIKQIAIPIGYGKFDVLNHESKNNTKKSSENKYILIAPSWGKNNILELIGIELIAELLDAGYYVVVRPHPAFYLTDKKIIIDEIEKIFTENINFLLENSNIENKSLYDADLLITDYSGVGMEFAFLNLKSVLYIDVPIKKSNDNWESFGITPLEISIRNKIGIVEKPNVEKILLAIDKLLLSEESFREKIFNLREHYLYNYSKCAQNAERAINNLIR